MPRKAKSQKSEPPIIAIIDTETDPFSHGAVIEPFVCGYYEWGTYLEFWGADCMSQMIDYIGSLKTKRIIYAHNGGKFDYFFMLEHLENPVKIINGRIAKAKCGIHEFRDSYSILPMPLKAYHKTPFAYDKMKRENRDKHKAEISAYLKDDCLDLYELVSAFNARFGFKLTIGSTAISELEKHHPFERTNERHDTAFRKYYFGGRVECFDSGVLKGDWKVFDVNSMYPSVMRNYVHPTGREYITRYNPDISELEGFYFATIECENLGAFPSRTKTGLDFNVSRGTFDTTSHEIEAAIDCGKAKNIKILVSHSPVETMQFVDFVDCFMSEKIAAKKSGNKIAEIFSKLILNSAYGKFGSNPENYLDWHIQAPGTDSPSGEFDLYMAHDCGVNLWTKPASRAMFFDVATAASITSAARSVLMRALSKTKRAVYCDTDSIICEGFPLAQSETTLGAWKLEGEGKRIAIAGKKLYALELINGKYKKACKGAVLSGSEIFKVARGGIVQWESEAPSFSLANGIRYTDRKIQSRI